MIDDLKAAKKEDLKALLGMAREYQGHVLEYTDNDIPRAIQEQKSYHPYFRNLKARFATHEVSDERLCEMVKAMCEQVNQHKIIDWHRNIEVEHRVRIELEDYLFDVVKAEHGVPLDAQEIDEIISLVWVLAVENREG